MFTKMDVTTLAGELARKYDMEMKEALPIATQMMIVEKLNEINEKIGSIEYKFTTDFNF